MTDYPPENEPLPSETPIHDRTAASEEGHEIRPGVTVPAWAAPTSVTPESAFEPVPDELALPAVPDETAVLEPQIPATGDATGSSGFPSGGSSGSGGGSRVDAAKGAAQNVAGDAKEAGHRVAGTAKEQAANVAGEATNHAKQMLGEAGDTLRQQAGEQQQRAAGGLRSISDQLHQMAEGASQETVASRIVRDLSNRAGSAAGYLEQRDPGSLVNEVKRFAAGRPGTFIAIAAGAGILAGRLTKALTSEIKHEHESAGSDAGQSGYHSPTVGGTGVGSTEFGVGSTGFVEPEYGGATLDDTEFGSTGIGGRP